MIEARQIAIMLNDAPQTEPCALCSRDVFTPAGPAVVVADSRALLCEDCGVEVVPELVALVKLGEAALVCCAMMDFGTPRYTLAPGSEKVC